MEKKITYIPHTSKLTLSFSNSMVCSHFAFAFFVSINLKSCNNFLLKPILFLIMNNFKSETTLPDIFIYFYPVFFRFFFFFCVPLEVNMWSGFVFIFMCLKNVFFYSTLLLIRFGICAENLLNAYYAHANLNRKKLFVPLRSKCRIVRKAHKIIFRLIFLIFPLFFDLFHLTSVCEKHHNLKYCGTKTKRNKNQWKYKCRMYSFIWCWILFLKF